MEVVQDSQDVTMITKDQAIQMHTAFVSDPTITGCRDFKLNVKLLKFLNELSEIEEEAPAPVLGVTIGELKDALLSLAAMSLVLSVSK